MDWNQRTAVELAAAMRAGDVTSEELTDAAIARIERDDTEINAICVRDFDRARLAARACLVGSAR
ncbi:amidase, partial [Streptomyces sp. NPDC095817]